MLRQAAVECRPAYRMTGGQGIYIRKEEEGELGVCSEAYGDKVRQDYEGSRNVRIHLCALRGADV